MFKTGTKSAHKIQSYGFLKMDRNDARLLKAWSTYFPIEIDFFMFYFACNFYKYSPIYTIFELLYRDRSCPSNVLNRKTNGPEDQEIRVPEDGPK